MRLQSSPELERYRAEVRAFIAEHSPGERTHTGVRAPDPEQIPKLRAWTAALFSAGYLGQNWPPEFGGQRNPDQAKSFVVAEEIARARAWEQVGAGPLASGAVIAFGTPEQQAGYLPKIRSGEHLWCQLFSEPGAGSDLAGLSTKARLVGDHYVINGQKVWTTNGHHADMGYLLARTDPTASKHRGITAFALNMKTPGVDVRPLREITGTSDFNEVFLDDVQIPITDVIGEVNEGWKVANASLGHERSGVAARGVELFGQLGDLIDLAETRRCDGVRPLDDGATRANLARLATRIHVTDLMSKTVQSRMIHKTEGPGDAPLVKIAFSEVNLAAAELGVRVQGIDGLLTEEDDAPIADGWWQDAFLYARAYTIAGGANEVLRTVVAERAFGLPREPVW
ncbi:MAG: acyl-CoA dehydrogenase [Gordonia sp.]|nr:acyl-CoA dehydrogenase [Gordonia sp. (in: high G+C Gram-positive bacteria)]